MTGSVFRRTALAIALATAALAGARGGTAAHPGANGVIAFVDRVTSHSVV